MNSIVIPEITQAQVRRVVKSLKCSAPGWDGPPASVGKQYIDSYIEPLTILTDMSFAQGIFPNKFKLARVVPIYKSGDKKEVSNYRPISVLSFYSKILEKIMYEYVVEFMDKNEIIFKNQFGFRKNHSTQHVVISLIHNIIHSQETDHMVISVFLDLKKAFDCVSHTFLLKKLYQYGIRSATHKWFTSYLTGRTQYFAVDDKKSDIQKITCGVPQGLVLGPLLFIAFANNICNASELLFYILYADGTAVLLKGSVIFLRERLVILNEELERINLWLKANKLTLNTQKSVFMVFHRARLKSFNPPILINGTQIQEVSSTKYLGLIIDNKLKWIDHIAHIKKKISRGIGIITRVRLFVSKKCLSNLYHAFIYPYLLYTNTNTNIFIETKDHIITNH